MTSPGKRRADDLDFTAPPTKTAGRTKKPSMIWNRVWAHTDIDINRELKPTGRYSLIIPNYSFSDAEGIAAAEAMEAVAKQQGVVQYKDHTVDNPTRRNEIVGYFFTPDGLDTLKDAAARSLGLPLGDTKGRNCVKKPEICMTITADQIEVTGDVLWLKDYFPMFNGEMQFDPATGSRKAIFPKDDPDYVKEALQKLTQQMGYGFQV